MSTKNNKIAIVRVSPKAGNIKHLWIYEERRNGWIRAGPEQNTGAGLSPTSWHAPQHVLKIVDLGTIQSELGPYDWNGIQPGTLVDVWGAFKGMVVGRKGAKYEVLRLGESCPIEVTWESLVPVDLDD